METTKKKILVVEDDQMISSMYKTKFEADGYDVVIANNGVEGYDFAKQHKPNIIMMDIILPQMDGFSSLEKIKKDPEIKDIPVIMLTNLGTEEDRAKGEKLGAIGYLVKARFTPAQVSAKIKEYLK